MKNKIKIALLVLGVVMLLWSVKPLVLLLFGSRTNGVLESVGDKDVTTEMTREIRSVQRPTGKFLVKTPVAYRFDVPATVAERLQRASDAPSRTGVRGEDVLYGRTTRPNLTAHEVGDTQSIIYLRAYPEFNAAYQPNAMLALGVMRVLGGLVLFVVWWFVQLGARKPRAKSPPKTT